MTYAIGEDCHIILSHPTVDSGAEYGFLLVEDYGIKSGGVQITREVDSGGSTQLWLHFDVLLSDNSMNPDGTSHAKTRAQDYAKLCQFLEKQSGVAVTFTAGTLVNLGAVGWTADERHMPSHALVKCQFNNVGVYWPPIDPLLLSRSVWAVDEQLRGALSWDSSYWR
jgi:hypothetical protein